MNTGDGMAMSVLGRNPVRHRFRGYHLRGCLAGVAWLSLMAASSGAAAQETPADSTAATAGPPVATAEDTGTAPGDIVVTATRQVSTVNKVPLSIAAFDQKALDARGARQVDDVLRFTPGVQFRRDISGVSQISIRGIQSPSGAATTGVYIDDTPIAARSIGFSPTTIYPAVFDLERVEVLRGPQGTLFGAGSAGGTVRFITPQPSLTATSVYGRAEVATTKSGDPSFEVGVAVGTPIIADRIGIRLSAWQRRDGGYVDHVQRTTGQLRDKNSDWQDTTALRAALSLVPVERLTLTPSIYYQRTYQNDQQAYTEYVSDPKDGVFINNSNANAPFRATIRLPALNAVYDAGPLSITANTSYYHQTNNIQRDYSDFLPTLLGSRTTPERGIPGYPEYTNQTIFTNEQKVWSNELRIASQDPGWITWVVGAFYQKQDQTAQQFLPERSAADFRRFVEGVTGRRLEAVFPVTSALVDGQFSTRNTLLSKESQVAGFGEATVTPIEHVKVILGARYSHTKFDFRQIAEGPYTGVLRRESGGVQEESPFTPKVGLEYEFNGSNRLYLTAAKGFRAGGANAALTDRCNVDLAAIGYSASPETFDSDTVWSYELGSKNRLFGNKLSVNASV
ncbi:outer membrane receptor protein involved in Fe transport [Sphingomonas sp. BK235]|nr:outer membrane receptor protein involved in Fe transport [Sphingomonas sp. BK235]